MLYKEVSLVPHGKVIWFVGLSGAGKTTISLLVQEKLREQGIACERLDGDDLRKTLCSDLGYAYLDRLENVRRVSFVAELLSRNGITVLVSLITPYREMRDHCRQAISSYTEAFVKCPLEHCINRDVKGI
jgi:adenylylsulfate kinase